MPFYTYQYYREETQSIEKSVCFSVNETLLLQELYAKGISPDSLSVLKEKRAIFINKGSLILLFFESLYGYVKAQIDLTESLEMIKSDKGFKQIIEPISQIQNLLGQGYDLPTCLSTFKQLFPQEIISIIQSSIDYGNLTLGLRQCIKYLKQQQEVKRQLIKTFLYPCFLILMLLVFLSIFFLGMLPALKAELPDKSLQNLSTLFFISDSLLRYPLELGLTFVITSSLILCMIKKYKGTYDLIKS